MNKKIIFVHIKQINKDAILIYISWIKFKFDIIDQIDDVISLTFANITLVNLP